MNLDDCGVHKQGFGVDFEDVAYVQLPKQFLNYTCLDPTIEPFIDNMPIAVLFG